VIFFHNTLQIDSLLREDNKIKGIKAKAQNDFDVDEGTGLGAFASSFRLGNHMGASPINEEELMEAGIISGGLGHQPHFSN